MPSLPRVNSHNPGCYLFLVDQSYSTNSKLKEGYTVANVIAHSVNTCIYQVIHQSVQGQKIKPYFEIGVIRYADKVESALNYKNLAGKQIVTLQELSEAHLRLDKTTLGVEGEWTSSSRELPIWIESRADGGTPMCEAFSLASDILSEWIGSHPEATPPIVMNITDGEATDGDPLEASRALHQLQTAYGSPFLFNIHVSATDARPTMLPTNKSGLPDEYSKTLFDMSGELTDEMLGFARQKTDLPAKKGARGFIYNSNPTCLMQLLKVGTTPTGILLPNHE